MRLFRFGYIFFFTIVFLSCSNPKSKHFKLCIDKIDLNSGERIVAFDLSIQGAIFNSISKVPSAWTMEISNNSSGFVKLKAGIIDFSAALEPSQLGCLATFTKTDFFDYVKTDLVLYVTSGEEREREVRVNQSKIIIKYLP